MADAVGRALHGNHATLENIRRHVFLSTLGFFVQPYWVCGHTLRYVSLSLRWTHLILLFMHSHVDIKRAHSVDLTGTPRTFQTLTDPFKT
jgi:hypothetical protein